MFAEDAGQRVLSPEAVQRGEAGEDFSHRALVEGEGAEIRESAVDAGEHIRHQTFTKRRDNGATTSEGLAPVAQDAGYGDPIKNASENTESLQRPQPRPRCRPPMATPRLRRSRD